jgi:heat shock protein HslJ
MRGYARAALLVPLLIIGGCARTAGDGSGGTGPGAPGSGNTPAPGGGTALPAGRTFIGTAVTEAGKPRPLVPGTRIEFQVFDERRIGMRAGCNSVGGDARLDGGRLRVGGLSTTEIGCDPALHAQDRWLADFVQAGPAWRLAGDELTLTHDDVEIRLTDREIAEPDLALTGTKWVVDTILTGSGTDQSASSVPAGVEAHLTFGADGSVRGSTGCNALTAQATVAGDQITVSDPVTTRMACDGPAGELERIMLTLLGQPVTYRTDADRLTLTGPDGAGLGFVG